MKAVLFIASIFFAGSLFSQIEAIEFNASFNKANSVDWLNDLTDCSTSAIDIMVSPDLQKKYKIVVVPTILILDDGEEIARFQANIMMIMESTKKEVQETIDELLMSNF
jgi:hypothetical protein